MPRGLGWVCERRLGAMVLAIWNRVGLAFSGHERGFLAVGRALQRSAVACRDSVARQGGECEARRGLCGTAARRAMDDLPDA